MADQPYIPDEDAFADQLVKLCGGSDAAGLFGAGVSAERVDGPPLPPTILVTLPNGQVFRVVVELEAADGRGRARADRGRVQPGGLRARPNRVEEGRRLAVGVPPLGAGPGHHGRAPRTDEAGRGAGRARCVSARAEAAQRQVAESFDLRRGPRPPPRGAKTNPVSARSLAFSLPAARRS